MLSFTSVLHIASVLLAIDHVSAALPYPYEDYKACVDTYGPMSGAGWTNSGSCKDVLHPNGNPQLEFWINSNYYGRFWTNSAVLCWKAAKDQLLKNIESDQTGQSTAAGWHHTYACHIGILTKPILH